MKSFSKIFIVTLAVLILVPFFQVDWVSAEQNLDVKAKAAILIDGNSGRILYSMNSDQSLPPASMTKMMTEYLVFDAVSEGKVNLNDTVTASEYAHWMGKYGGSRVYLAQGEKRTIEELIYAMAVYSANDATVALAEHLAGSEANFVEMMNIKAQEFGMAGTVFVTSTGFPADELDAFAPLKAGDNQMSANDAALLAWHLVNDHPEALKYTSTPFLTFRPGEGEPLELKDLPNWNWMLPGVVSTHEYPGVDGLKTGYTSEAGYNFTGTAKRNGVRLISVVMGTTSKDERFNETKKLFDYGFSNYEMASIIKANTSVQNAEKVAVNKGKDKEVTAIAKSDLDYLVKKGENDLYSPITKINENIEAPIEKGQSLGYITFEYTGTEELKYVNEELKNKERVDLVAEEEVEKASFIRLFFRKILEILSAIFNAITNW